MEDHNETKVTEFIFLAFTKSSQHPVLLFVVLLSFYLLIICFNILMMLAITHDPRLHTPMYFFVFALSCMDICYLSTIVPQTLSNLVSRTSGILYNNCATQMFFFTMIGELQITLITIMAYDRYVAVSQPLHYTTIMSLETCLKLLGLAFGISCFFSALLVYFIFRVPFCQTPTINHFYCDMGEVMLLTCHKHKLYFATEVTVFLLGIGILTFPQFIVIASYINIIHAVLKICTTEGRWKSFSTCSSHLTVVVVEYGCLGFMYFRPPESYYLDKDKVFVMTFTCLTPILNPLVYTVRNKVVLDGFKKLLSKKMF